MSDTEDLPEDLPEDFSDGDLDEEIEQPDYLDAVQAMLDPSADGYITNYSGDPSTLSEMKRTNLTDPTGSVVYTEPLRDIVSGDKIFDDRFETLKEGKRKEEKEDPFPEYDDVDGIPRHHKLPPIPRSPFNFDKSCREVTVSWPRVSMYDDDKKAEKNILPGYQLDAFMKDISEDLIKTGAVIAGGAVLRHLLNTNFWVGDIDIWVPYRKDAKQTYGPLFEYLFKTGRTYWRKIGRNSRHEAVDPKDKTINNPQLDYVRMSSTIHTMYNFMTPAKNNPVQLIVINPGLDLNSVISTFDLEICQVGFDGVNFFTPQPKEKYLNMLVTKTTNISDNAIYGQSFFEWLRTAQRIDKYAKRGITTSPDVWDKFNMMDLCKYIYFEQISKYVDKWNDLQSVRPELPYFELNDIKLDFILYGRVLSSKTFVDLAYFKGVKLYKELTVTTRGENAIDFIEEAKEPSMCYDVSMASDTEVKEYLDENKDGIVIITSKDNAVCTTVEVLSWSLGKKKYIDSDVYYECLPGSVDNHYEFPENRSDPYVLLRLTSNYLVKLDNIYYALNAMMRGAQVFKISPLLDIEGKHVRLPATVSHGVLIGRQDYVSADHCQGGTDKLVYKLQIVGDSTMLKKVILRPDRDMEYFIRNLIKRIVERILEKPPGQKIKTMNDLFDVLGIDKKLRYMNTKTNLTYDSYIENILRMYSDAPLGEREFELLHALVKTVLSDWKKEWEGKGFPTNASFYKFLYESTGKRSKSYLRGLAALIGFSYTGMNLPNDKTEYVF